MSHDMNDLLEVVTNGLIEAEVFEEFAKADDLRDILPHHTLEDIEKALSAESTETNEGDGMNTIDLEALPDEVQVYIADLEKAAKASDTLVEPTEAELVEEVLKSVDPAVAEIIKAGRARTAELEDEVAKQAEARDSQVFLAKAARFDGVVDDIPSFATVLRTLEKASPEAATALEGVLEVAAERIAKGNLFAEAGHTAPASSGSAEGRATAIAKSWVDEGKYEDIESARADVWEAHPDLYNDYLAERQAR